jgi:hypothetical protein
MAYSKAPAISTYETKRVNFFQTGNPRAPGYPANGYSSAVDLKDRDFRLLNMMVEEVPNQTGQSPEFRLKSRPFLVNTAVMATPATPRGIYTYKNSPVGPGGQAETIYRVSGNKLYNSKSLTPLVTTLSTSTGPVGWAEFLSSTGTRSLILVDGVDGYVILTDTLGETISCTKITDPDFPTPHIPNPIVIDAYLFLAKANTNDIYNSNLDNPLLWTAGNFISAEMYADRIVALAKNNNYLYAFGTDSVEFFYDNANPTGSPLARQQSAVQQMGCEMPETVVQTEKQVVFVGTTSNGGLTVWVIDSFQATEISTTLIKTALNYEMINNPTNYQRSAYVIRVNNQKLYVLRLTDRTFVYSFDTQMWSEWNCKENGTTVSTGADINFMGVYASDAASGSATIQLTHGYWTIMAEDLSYTPNLANQYFEFFNCMVISQRLNFDTINKKTMSRFSILGDSLPDIEAEVHIQWSDDDGETWFPADPDYRTLSLSTTSRDLPAIHQLGSFRQRSFKIKHLHYQTPFRIQGIEVNINKGNT